VNISLFVIALALAQHPAMPPGMTHEEHLAQMKKDAELERRGKAAMGFDQHAATHHFRIADDGGAIEVAVNDADDRATLDAIRTHLTAIARAFAEGRFDAPVATHGELPPGVRELQRLKDAIAYRYEPIAAGGRVRITASSPDAVAAVHAFLRYQIREHKTGDPG
jgi:hypothetical protein